MLLITLVGCAGVPAPSSTQTTISSNAPTSNGFTPTTIPAKTSTTATIPTLSSIAITPEPQITMHVGATQRFTAIGKYSDNSIKDISNTVKWASNNAEIAYIDITGLVTGLASGTTVIFAHMSPISSQKVLLTVVP